MPPPGSIASLPGPAPAARPFEPLPEVTPPEADATAAETGLALARQDVQRNRIVDPFVTEKGRGAAGEPRMMTLRDRIRADGPTIDYRTGTPTGA